MIIGTSHLCSFPNWLLDWTQKLWAHLEGDVIELSAVAEGRSAGVNQPGGRRGCGGQTSPRPPAVSAAARRRLGALGAPFAFHCLLPGHGSGQRAQLRAMKKKTEERVRVTRWLLFLSSSTLSLPEFWSRRVWAEKFTCASKSCLCVKRKMVPV